MRISSNKDDPGYDERIHTRGAGIKVLLNGVELRSVTVADEERGEVVVNMRDDNGRIYTDPPGSNDIAQATLTGRVKIILPPNWNDPLPTKELTEKTDA